MGWLEKMEKKYLESFKKQNEIRNLEFETKLKIREESIKKLEDERRRQSRDNHND